MGRKVSSNVQEAIQQEELSIRMLMEVYLRVADIPTATYISLSKEMVVEGEYLVMRFVANDTQSLTIPPNCTDSKYANKTYICADISRGSIDTATDGQIEKTTIKVSNKWQTYAAIFANLGNIMNNRRCVILEYFPDFPSEPPIIIFDGVMNGVKMTASQFEWELKRSLVDFNAESPNMTYDVSCQWQFKDKHCKFAGGSISNCDKTMDTCEALGNILNFGGHPSVPREMVIRSN